MRKLAGIALTVAVGVAAAAPASAQVPGRDADPIVLKGSALPELLGAEPADVVAFRWTGSAWDQIPVQTDERAAVPFNQIYDDSGCAFACNWTGAVDVYTDPSTWTGADPVVGLDSGDEVSLMAKDTGPQAPGPQADPANVTAGTRSELQITDPISGTDTHFAYLFESDGSLASGAGESYVDYDFNLTAGDYQTSYLIPDGPNPETSTVETDYYRHGELKDRWYDESLEVLGRGSTEVDILDGDKVQFYPTTCARSEKTFAGYATDPAEGAFIANVDGPVRAIRSYVGANSGPSTQKTHIYYEQRQDVNVNLRVHSIPGVMSFLDYSPAASGMTYRNPQNPGGLTIDGVPESANASAGGPEWEQVTGSQGTLDIVNRFVTDISPLTVTNYWYDDSTPDSGHLQCTGDAAAYGSSGSWVTSTIPTTDPKDSGFKNLSAVRHMFYDAPNQPASQAELRNQQIVSNLGVKVDGTVAIPPGAPPATPVDPGNPGGGQTTDTPAKPNKCKKGKVRKKGKCVKKRKKKRKKK